MKRLILGSKSPRRADLLRGLGYEFEVRPGTLDESVPVEIEPQNVAQYLAVQKAEQIEISAEEVLICADTTVLLDNQILGKPESPDDAHDILTALSGKVHRVLTGVCIRCDKQIQFTSSTQVKFQELTPYQISAYIASGAPMDKAGAYGIQDWIGMTGIEWIEGCYYNVMGLPTREIYQALTDIFGVTPVIPDSKRR